MAGIILSAGSPSHPKQIGVAPEARLFSGRISNKQLYQSNVAKALNTFIKKQHCRVIMTGIQLTKDIVAGDGDSRWSKMYDYYAETYDVFFASATGNSSPQVTVFGDLYNGITTAGAIQSDPNGPFDTIGSISNPGPTTDGRKKPDIAACTQGLIVPTSSGDDHWSTLDTNGRGLTSYAVPHTAGVAALLFEAAAKNPVENDDKTEVIKAIIVNSSNPFAFESDTSIGSPDDSISAWKPDSGYGILDAFKAYKTLMAGPIEPDTPTRQKRGWAYGIMGKNKEHTYLIQAGQEKRLLITVTWHRKLQKIGSQYIEESVPFHLNLKVLSPSGKMLAFESVEPNNLIKTDLLLKEDGQYKIILKNPTLATNRDYGAAFELLDLQARPAN
jgi:hypothetical protein